jgi:hypothetical protein
MLRLIASWAPRRRPVGAAPARPRKSAQTQAKGDKSTGAAPACHVAESVHPALPGHKRPAAPRSPHLGAPA